MDNLEFASACLWQLLASFKYREHYQRNIEMAKHDMVKKSILFMQDHINESLVLKDIASHCGYSVSHFSLMFRKKTTRSPIGYFISLKMQRACQMLDFTLMHIKEIAAELDFEDQFYFSRLFRKVIGESPSAYRKRNLLFVPGR
jgi:AraC-like DNA-binding protein